MINIFSKNKEEQSKTHRVIFQIQGMHCVACSLNIEGELEDTPGVRSASANYARATCTVEYDPALIDEDWIIAIVKKLGYDLTPQLK